MSINFRTDLYKPFGSIKRLTYIHVLLFSLVGVYTPTFADNSCWIGGGTLQLGTANALGSSTASTNLTVTCNSNYSRSIHYKMCLTIDSTGPAGNDPRQMINYNTSPASLLQYQLYYDAAQSRKIPGSNQKNQAQCQTFQLQANAGTQNSLIKLYGRVLPGQNVPAGFYKTNSATLKLYYAHNYDSEAPSDSEVLGQPNTATNNFVVNSNYENSCLIQSATDIDFGTVEQIKSPISGSGKIQLACPQGTEMQVSLNEGLNAAGPQRRMRNMSGDYIQYNLYRDANRSQAWGNNNFYPVDEQTIQIYANVMPQPIRSVGRYSDTVTVTLTY